MRVRSTYLQADIHGQEIRDDCHNLLISHSLILLQATIELIKPSNDIAFQRQPLYGYRFRPTTAE